MAIDHERVKLRMAALLLADVVGYSRLMDVDEEDTHLRLDKIKKDLIDLTTISHNGRMIRSMCDGMLVEFDCATEAVVVRGVAIQILERKNDIRGAACLGVGA